MKARQFVVFAAALSLLAWIPSLASAAKLSSLQPATSTISDGYDVQSDGQGSYQNGVDGVSSEVNVNWVLDLTTSALRSASVSLNSGVNGNTPPQGIQTSGQLKLQVDCFRVPSPGVDMVKMQQGQVSFCPALIRLPLISKLSYYVLDMAELGSETETTQVQVTCNAVTSGQCSDWFVDPIGTQATARLNLVTSKGTANKGDFYLTFHYHITQP